MYHTQVQKAQLKATGQCGRILSEKQSMSGLHHPFIARLFTTLRTDTELFFLMEPCMGGDLFAVKAFFGHI